MWFVFALLSAIFAALTSILAKVGINGVNSHRATAIRTGVVVIMAWGMVYLTNAQKLDFSYSFRAFHRGVMALLLQGIANRRGIEGCAC